MREIKFRAWDSNIKKMTYDDFTISPKGALSFYWQKDQFNSAHSHLMQFTGLRDSKGKEIYHKDQFKANRKTYTVEWNEEFGAWEVRWVDVFADGMEAIKLDRRCMLKYFMDDNPKALVIGNIYESNPQTND